ncbi:unnamed protein product [Ilex paraguariensis]|uniref:Uncharacterized protein n=1 Tax=Ilex paraguariensis TaxID=185542 RepID=A0ABC8QRR2_9AQUA
MASKPGKSMVIPKGSAMELLYPRASLMANGASAQVVGDASANEVDPDGALSVVIRAIVGERGSSTKSVGREGSDNGYGLNCDAYEDCPIGHLANANDALGCVGNTIAGFSGNVIADSGDVSRLVLGARQSRRWSWLAWATLGSFALGADYLDAV